MKKIDVFATVKLYVKCEGIDSDQEARAKKFMKMSMEKMLAEAVEEPNRFIKWKVKNANLGSNRTS